MKHYNNSISSQDFGGCPYVTNIESATLNNTNFRKALWTGDYYQLTLMCIPAGEEIGAEIHEDTDQFLRVEAGIGVVKMGQNKDCMNFATNVKAGSAILVPAGYWHNLINTGNCPLKLYSIYAPPHHPKGTVHRTKADAQEH